MISRGHALFRLLQEGAYFAAKRGVVDYDYWDELPPDRRDQYERAAEAFIAEGIDLQKKRSPDV